MIAILARKKNITKLTKKNIGESEERLGERLFVCLFVGGCCWRPSDRWGESGENVFVQRIVVVATALLPILHQSTTQANLSFVVSNKSTTILHKPFSFCSASHFLQSFLVSLSFVAQAKGGGSSCDWGTVRFQFMDVVERFQPGSLSILCVRRMRPSM